MLDVSVSYNRYKFLGYEFLTWLWFILDEGKNQPIKIQNDPVLLEVDNRIVLENSLNNMTESVTIKGDGAGLEEAKLSLQKGGVVTECSFLLKTAGQEWRFCIKGENLTISSLKPPETGRIEKKDDEEGCVLEKYYLYEKVVVVVESLYNRFIKLRISKNWETDTVPRLKKWIKS
ncbi:MAG: hypothetical protein R6X10_12740 [Desulfobacterales bacterium]